VAVITAPRATKGPIPMKNARGPSVLSTDIMVARYEHIGNDRTRDVRTHSGERNADYDGFIQRTTPLACCRFLSTSAGLAHTLATAPLMTPAITLE